jgi:hypothetical protein
VEFLVNYVDIPEQLEFSARRRVATVICQIGRFAHRVPAAGCGSTGRCTTNRIAAGWPEPQGATKPHRGPRTRRKQTLFWNAHVVAPILRESPILHENSAPEHTTDRSGTTSPQLYRTTRGTVIGRRRLGRPNKLRALDDDA